LTLIIYSELLILNLNVCTVIFYEEQEQYNEQ
jgi:hypothetical protein